MQRWLIPVYSFIFLMIFALSSTLAFADISVDASLSHHSFPAGKAARLTITVNGTSRSADIELPEIEGLRFHSRGQSSRINMVNGNVSSSITNGY